MIMDVSAASISSKLMALNTISVAFETCSQMIKKIATAALMSNKEVDSGSCK